MKNYIILVLILSPLWLTHNVYASDTDIAKNGGWIITHTKSPMDDTKGVILSLAAENKVLGFPNEAKVPTLNIRCKEKNIDIFINVGMSFSVENINKAHTLRLRIDNNKAYQQTWNESSDGHALFLEFADDPVAIKKR